MENILKILDALAKSRWEPTELNFACFGELVNR